MDFRQRLESIHAHPSFANALLIVERLQSAGHVAVLAGGCVRDGLLDQSPHDLDIATSARPEFVEALFERTLAVGKAFGTIMVVLGEQTFEVTTFRREGPYLDGRHPSSVSFTEMLEDAKRRDFTVNALFYDPRAERVFDYVGGCEDLKSRRLRAVGEPRERFSEDRLRMLRAIRFVSQLGFDLESQSLEAIQTLYADLKTVSAERVLAECKRLLVGAHLQKALKVLLQSRLQKVFWPEIEQIKIFDLKFFSPFLNWENAFSGLMLLAGQFPEERLRAWKVSRESLVRVREQMRATQVLLSPSARKVERVKALGGECYAEILVLTEGLLKVSGRSPKDLQVWVQDYLSVADRQGVLPEPFLSGEDLLSIGFAPGARMGAILKELYEHQLEGLVKSREEALRRLKSYVP